MKTFIVYISYHHWNTEKITKPIGEVLEAELRSPRAHLKAFDVYSSLRPIGGKDKERPNEGDIQDAKRFAQCLKASNVARHTTANRISKNDTIGDRSSW